MMTDRYSRLARFHKIGNAGVEAFQKAKVVILGCGALGAQHAETLARSGFGQLTLIDRDFVESSNLQRQTLFTESDAINALPKVIALKHHLREINSSIEVRAHIADVSSDNIEALIAGHDLLLDGTDNLALRMLINDACYKLQIPWIFGTALESYGMSFNFNFPVKENKDGNAAGNDNDNGNGNNKSNRIVLAGNQSQRPCLRCLLGSLPLDSLSSEKMDSCSSVGVIQPILQLISGIQTSEAMKFFAGFSATRDTLFTMDLWEFHSQNINLDQLKDSDCPTCGDQPTYPDLHVKTREAQRLCGDGSIMIREVQPLDLDKIRKELDAGNIRYQYNDYFLNIHLENNRVILFHDGRGIVYGVHDIEQAMIVYRSLIIEKC